jgi:hypothetical protein
MSGRSGSSLLVSYLNQIPDLICYPEILVNKSNFEQTRIFKSIISGDESKFLDKNSSIGYSGVLPTEKDIDKIVAAGFKVKYGDLHDLHGFIQLCNDNKIKILYLTRENILRAALSRLRAQKLFKNIGDYNMTSTEQAIGPIFVDINQFDKLLDSEENYYHSLNDIVTKFDTNVLGESYETLIVNLCGSLNKILSYLGSSFTIKLESQGLESKILCINTKDNSDQFYLQERVLKMTSDLFSESIINYEEFIEYYKKTKYKKWIDSI